MPRADSNQKHNIHNINKKSNFFLLLNMVQNNGKL